jgi:hypothetical protein
MNYSTFGRSSLAEPSQHVAIFVIVLYLTSAYRKDIHFNSFETVVIDMDVTHYNCNNQLLLLFLFTCHRLV